MKPDGKIAGRPVGQPGSIRSRVLPGDDARLRSLPSEVPVAISFDGSSAGVVMASDSDIADLAHGFALTEGFVSQLDDIRDFEIAVHDLGIEARFWLNAPRSAALAERKRLIAGPVGCGLCGIDSLEQAMRDIPSVAETTLRLSTSDVLSASESLAAQQVMHRTTGAMHAAGFLVPGRGVIALREDVGRHNALDKLIGALWRDGIEPSQGAFVMSSRLSLELVQKCALAGSSTLICVSAPTAQALRVAQRAGLTLIGFARQDSAEVFCGEHRLAGDCHPENF